MTDDPGKTHYYGDDCVPPHVPPEPATEPPFNARLSWNQPQCENCWIEREATWDGDVLTGIRAPVRLTEPVIERCAWCGEPTIFGVYRRADPTTVLFPATKGDGE
jgi:hypothetical protein